MISSFNVKMFGWKFANNIQPSNRRAPSVRRVTYSVISVTTSSLPLNPTMTNQYINDQHVPTVEGQRRII